MFNSFHRYHCDVKNNKFIIVIPASRKMSAIISTTPQSRPTSTPPYFSISPSTSLLVLAIFGMTECVFIYRTYHIVSWRFTILIIEWDRTSACEGASGSSYQLIFELIHPPTKILFNSIEYYSQKAMAQTRQTGVHGSRRKAEKLHLWK